MKISEFLKIIKKYGGARFIEKTNEENTYLVTEYNLFGPFIAKVTIKKEIYNEPYFVNDEFNANKVVVNPNARLLDSKIIDEIEDMTTRIFSKLMVANFNPKDSFIEEIKNLKRLSEPTDFSDLLRGANQILTASTHALITVIAEDENKLEDCFVEEAKRVESLTMLVDSLDMLEDIEEAVFIRINKMKYYTRALNNPNLCSEDFDKFSREWIKYYNNDSVWNVSLANISKEQRASILTKML